METGKRIELLDAARGLAVCVMLVLHFLYDLCAFCNFPWVWFSNPLTDALHYVFAGLFILLSGICANYSRSNVKRGLKTLAVALVITGVTTAVGLPIVCGVLHLLSVCMLFYGLTRSFWEALPPWAVPALSAVGAAATARLVNGVPTTVPHLWMFGLVTPDFYSSDYFPLPPWAFVFLFGTWAGQYIRQGRMPKWFYEAGAPHLAAIGRHSMLIYIVHQPVLYLLVMAWLRLSR